MHAAVDELSSCALVDVLDLMYLEKKSVKKIFSYIVSIGFCCWIVFLRLSGIFFFFTQLLFQR